MPADGVRSAAARRRPPACGAAGSRRRRPRWCRRRSRSPTPAPAAARGSARCRRCGPASPAGRTPGGSAPPGAGHGPRGAARVDRERAHGEPGCSAAAARGAAGPAAARPVRSARRASPGSRRRRRRARRPGRRRWCGRSACTPGCRHVVPGAGPRPPRRRRAPGQPDVEDDAVGQPLGDRAPAPPRRPAPSARRSRTAAGHGRGRRGCPRRRRRRGHPARSGPATGR